MTRLQARHARQSAIPDCFAAATLASSARPARTPAERAQRAKDARKVCRLITRGELRLSRSELEVAIARPFEVDIETAFSEAGR